MPLLRPSLCLLAALSLLLTVTPAVAEGTDAAGFYVIHAGTLIDGSGGDGKQVRIMKKVEILH